MYVVLIFFYFFFILVLTDRKKSLFFKLVIQYVIYINFGLFKGQISLYFYPCSKQDLSKDSEDVKKKWQDPQSHTKKGQRVKKKDNVVDL